MTFTVGQKLWFVPQYNRSPYEVEVKKVGRIWLHAERYSQTVRINAKTLQIHDDDGHGRVYLSKEDHDFEVALNNKWREFRKALDAHNWRTPQGVTVEQIEQAMQLLRLK